MEEPLLMRRRPRHRGRLPLRRLRARPVTAELGVGDELRFVRRGLRDVELRDRDGSDLVEKPGVPAFGEGDEASLLLLDLGWGALGQRGKRVPERENRVELLLDGRREA